MSELEVAYAECSRQRNELLSKLKSQAQPTEERNFCPRCGKRLSSGFVEISIHTCTPPKEKKNE